MCRNLFVWLSVSTAMVAADTYTFSKDVLPILQNKCQECHRPGEIGPMPLLNYKEVRPWAKAIREAVLTRKMPPWHADPAVGRFLNDQSLTAAEIHVLSKWVEGGAPEGEYKDSPVTAQSPVSWRLGTPDVVLEPATPFDVPPEER